MKKLRVLDLFSGIGGFSLGLERTGGFETVAFCEIDPFCRRVLAKHWPSVPIHEDVRHLRARHVEAADVICGGFPCQDISKAGKGAGLAGERSGLWFEYARLISEVRPRYVLVENVSALLGRGLGTVLGDLAALGFDAWWHCVPASAIGAPHDRDRVWIVAYTSGLGVGEFAGGHFGENIKRNVAEIKQGRFAVTAWAQATGFAGSVAEFIHAQPDDPDDDGLSAGLAALGNAVVPQIPELIGRAILAAETHDHGRTAT